MNNKYKNRASRRYSTRSSFLEKKKKKFKITISIILMIIVIIGILYLMFFSSLFIIKDINISFQSGPFLTSKQEILNNINSQMNKKHFLGLQENNIFIFNNKIFYNKINNDSRIESISIKKGKIPSCSLSIIINEAKPVANLSVLNGDNYFISSKGKVIKYSTPSMSPVEPTRNLEVANFPPKTSPKNTINTQSIQTVNITENNLNKAKSFNIKTLPKIYDKTHLDLSSKKVINIFKKIINFIDSGILLRNGVGISKIELNEQSGGIINIKIFTDKDWLIYLTSETNFENQIKNLELAFQNELKTIKNLEYIDLRFKNRIFYKNKTENKQIQNY